MLAIPDSDYSPHLSPRRSGLAIIIALMLLAIAPVLFASVPGKSDLPNHIARHHILAEPDRFQRMMDVHWWWIGNLGFDLPVVALAPLLGAEQATRLIVGLIAPLGVIGVIALGRAAHERVTASAMIALSLVLAPPYFYGFINYSLLVALAFLAAAF